MIKLALTSGVTNISLEKITIEYNMHEPNENGRARHIGA